MIFLWNYCLLFLFITTACNNTENRTKKEKELANEWKIHLRPKDSIVNVMKIGETFALESSEVQGIDREAYKQFDYWKEMDTLFFERTESKDFSNPDEAGGSIVNLEIFKAIKKGETEIRFYKKHYYGNRDPQDSSYVKDTTTLLYNSYKFRIE